MSPDAINSLFEFAGGWFVLLNVIRLHRDKRVAGVHWGAVTFFSVWGYWNLVYYPSLEQWWSAAGALGVAIANTIWLGQIIYYSRKARHGVP